MYSDVKGSSLSSATTAPWTRKEWGIWLTVMVVATILRVAFYTGYFGSDEVTYIGSAFKILQGDWSVSQYVGSNRYGVNLPVAAFVYIFGQNEFAANMYSLLCSLGEIALIFYFGRSMFGLRVAVLATTVLAFLPLHVHFAGRLMADSPLALMITASFLFFWDGERKNSIISFLIAGLAAGLSFWIKPQTIIYLLIFLTYPLIIWRWNWKWKWMITGFALPILGIMIFSGVLTSDPFYLFKTIQARHSSGYLEAGGVEQSPIFYLIYLFIKVWHTWLMPYLAVAAILIWLIQYHNLSQREKDSLVFIAWWAGGLLVVFSLFIVSWNPLIFIPKQTNYMLIFIAPLALLAGYALAALRGIILWVVMSFVILPSTMLAAMEQNSIHVFTANSKAVVEFAKQNTGAEVFSHANPYRAVIFRNLVNPRSPEVKIRSVDELLKGNDNKDATRQVNLPKYVVMDTETLSWGAGEPIRDIKAVPSCWIQTGVLEPSEFGLGWRILNTLRVAGQFLPATVQEKVTRGFNQLTQPRPAYLYVVPEEGCDFEKMHKITP